MAGRVVSVGSRLGSAYEMMEKTAMEDSEIEVSITAATPQEMASLELLVKQCREQGLLDHPVGLSAEDSLEGLKDEVTLLRFLRGRELDVGGALKQFKEAQSLRGSVDANATYDKMDVAEFESLRSMYPNWTGQRSKRGLPICLFDPIRLDDRVFANYQDGGAVADNKRRAMMAFDYMQRFVIPLCSAIQQRPDQHVPVTSAIYLVDLSNISLKLAWNIRSFVQQVSTLLATCYPEVVDTIYVLNSPSYIARIWALLKNWVEPRTAGKLVFLSPAEGLDRLLDMVDIESIPELYGGKSKAMHGKFPCLDEPAKQLLGVEVLPEGPIKWSIGSRGNRTAVAVGTRNGEARREVIGPIGED
ncbi:CRAL/TRIO domain protein [Xylariaceae sp. FL0594]|nr:CRAL/TRIO domain protein [Xylariaceae sp. FL0594]